MFAWREIGRRPPLSLTIARCGAGVWPLFRPHHYMSAELARQSQCFLLRIAGRPAAFAAIINFPHPTAKTIRRVHRVVTLPDWQGLGLGMVLLEALGGAHRARGLRLRLSTRSAWFGRTLQRSPRWRLAVLGAMQARNLKGGRGVPAGCMGGIVGVSSYEFVGPPDPEAAALLLA